jgi:dTDP-4-dehydrorhamnose reductase
MKILVTGAEGNIGNYLHKHLSLNHEVYPLKKSDLDITNKVQSMEVLKEINPNILIHSAGLCNIDLCERDERSAYSINTIGSLNMAYACNLLNIPIAYISCSHVYDGSKTSPYYETDECTPINVYGKTKLAGEKLIRTISTKYFILRTSWIYGSKNCFVDSVVNNKDIPLFMSSSEISTPTYIKDFCMALEKIIHSDLYGIYNITNSGAAKKSLWIKTILDYINVKKDVIEIPGNYISNRALRPKCTILNNDLIKNCFDIELPSWETSLKEYLSK